ncbi:hypothetical protein PIB30_009900 [Stylosanthes scabra]|uniref:Secreted protein n=1 Tax=Stylosanthes scabra TaxID=79078 RepID=A0ABU6S5W1_9FABA|nr:hypothetical protein [Stylosanthes scabra]
MLLSWMVLLLWIVLHTDLNFVHSKILQISLKIQISLFISSALQSQPKSKEHVMVSPDHSQILRYDECSHTDEC